MLANSLKLYYTPSQMFSQECFEASFEIVAPKNVGKYTAKRMKLSFLSIKYEYEYEYEFPLDKIAPLQSTAYAPQQSTAYYRTENFTTDYFS